MYKTGDKIRAIIYGKEWHGTITRIGESGIIFALSDQYKIERFFFPESIKKV